MVACSLQLLNIFEAAIFDEVPHNNKPLLEFQQAVYSSNKIGIQNHFWLSLNGNCIASLQHNINWNYNLCTSIIPFHLKL